MPEAFNLTKNEEKILDFWRENKIFEKSLEIRKKAKRFVFFEGPPTANGRPGMHHLIGRAFKDLFVRYKTMRGFLVERKAGWDTQGLAVEIEVEKELGLKNKKDIEKYGIGRFNAKARESVWKYKDEWERFTERIGFWLDMRHPYITYEPNYIETLWWIIKEIDKKGLLYQGHKVLPWCPRCGTALSSHEVAQGYENITETSVYVKFHLLPGQKFGERKEYETGDSAYILSWTTTPWTLPGNVALAAGKNIKYSAVRVDGVGELLIVAENLVDTVFKGRKVEKVHTFTGSGLIGLEYKPLFDVKALKTAKAYKVYPAEFVTTQDGTGIVHTAVMYGEDDYQLGAKLGLPKHHTVDEQGKFTIDVEKFQGQYVKDAESGIIDYLKNKNLLFKTQAYAHDYPFCWRCKNPLLYYAKNSWFVAMSKLQRELIKNNHKVNWIPQHLRDGRFGEFLKEVKDWAFSRERFWGTPLPIWHCAKCNKNLVIGSLAELEKNRFRPKNTYYILRHGESTKDAGGPAKMLISSKLKNDKYDLMPEGVEEIRKAIVKIKKEGGVDLIFSSPFIRTKHSAQIAAEELSSKVQVDHRLVEHDLGITMEGKPHALSWLETKNLKFNEKLSDGESWFDVKKRMFEFLSEIDKKHEGKKILIVSHGTPLWVLECAVKNFTNQEIIDGQDRGYLRYGESRKIDFQNLPYNKSGDLDPHKPYIDDIFLKCAKCGQKMTRVKEVADVWFDSGSMPFAQWHYPFENKTEFKNNFPADFISEGIDQTRGWFYTLLTVSTLLDEGPAYKNVVSYSHVLDENGKKMSKSLGNIVDPWQVIDQSGADPVRWYFYSVNAPGDSKLFSVRDSLKQPKSFTTTILNMLNFFHLYDKLNPNEYSALAQGENILDEWVLSRLNKTISQITSAMDKYDPTSASRLIESFAVGDLSNWWLRRSRERFQRPKNQAQLELALNLLRHMLLELSKVLAPFTPFLAEHLYKKLSGLKESVHLDDWPVADNKSVDDKLEKEMERARNDIAQGLAQRKEKNIKVRQPLYFLTVVGGRFNKGIERLIQDELNVKEVRYEKKTKPESDDAPMIADVVKLDTQLTPALIAEGYAREVIRQIQDMRKEAGYGLSDKIFAAWETNNKDAISAIRKFEGEISRAALLKEFTKERRTGLAFDVEKEFNLAPGIDFWLGVRIKK